MKPETKLALDWEKILKKHARPLERGAKAKGVKKIKGPIISEPVLFRRETPKYKSLKSGNVAVTKPITDPSMLEAVHQLRHRVGVAFNKGGLQYLTDSDLQDSKAGLLRRR